MMTVIGVQPKVETMIRNIEEAADSGNMRALDMAINFFEAGNCEVVPMCDLKVLRSLAEKGLRASDEIGRLMSEPRVY